MRIEIAVVDGEVEQFEANEVQSVADAALVQKVLQAAKAENQRDLEAEDEDEDEDPDVEGEVPQSAAAETLQGLMGRTQKAIAVPFAVDPANLPDRVIFLDKQGRKVGEITNLAEQPQIDVRAQA